MHMSLSKHQEMVKDRETWHAVIYGVTKSQTSPSEQSVSGAKIKGWSSAVREDFLKEEKRNGS